MRPGRLSYLETVTHLVADTGCVPSDAYTRYLAFIDDSTFLPNSELMREIVMAMLARPAVTAARFKRHAEHETAGAEILERVANRTAPPEWRARLLAHALDEYRHGRMFGGFCAKISRVTGFVMPSINRLDTTAHARSFDGNMINFMIATHVAELRSLALLRHYEDGLAIAPPQLRLLLSKLVATVTRDERRHVAYTGALVSDLVAESDASESTLYGYLDVYNRDTWTEISVIAALLGEMGSPSSEMSAPA